MFCFKLWSRFGAFRDPLTITQNLTFPIPPKTTIGGILASILGIDYTEYFNDPEYFNFSYSLILTKPIRKRSIAQNYVADYTGKSETKFNALTHSANAWNKLKSLLKKKERLEQKITKGKADAKFLVTADAKIIKAKINAEKSSEKCNHILNKGLRSPKPIFRELLMNPEYLIFIKDFKYEETIIPRLKRHESAYSFYMGNSEFSANYRFLDCSCDKKSSDTLHSFTAMGNNILFEEGKQYTSLFFATRTCGNREYRDYKRIVLCDKPIQLKSAVPLHILHCDKGRFNCEFI